MKTRKYRQKQRAAQQQETRERIVDAAMALHEEIGPAATTISALADRAGVQRLTVYRHFANDQEIFQACSTKWMGRHPPPDLSAIPAGNAAEATRAILLALYRYYDATQDMWHSLYQDLGKVDGLDEAMGGFDDYLATAEKAVLSTWVPQRSKKLRATVRHALRFSSWQSLAGQGLKPGSMATLVCTWIAAAAA
ncbi:MAG TPA: helix-turn-helix domain-containing protein [Woeseiaceae bacterium]|nr:helix-turn-helix domain-containing protein [Woeseiaceae bacterium]